MAESNHMRRACATLPLTQRDGPDPAQSEWAVDGSVLLDRLQAVAISAVCFMCCSPGGPVALPDDGSARPIVGHEPVARRHLNGW